MYRLSWRQVSYAYVLSLARLDQILSLISLMSDSKPVNQTSYCLVEWTLSGLGES